MVDTMPTPKEWPDKDRLVQDLKKYDWQDWFALGRRGESESSLKQIIKQAVEGNTFRAFKKRRGHSPSVVFREWANNALVSKTLKRLWSVESQNEFDEWLSELVRGFTKYWNSRMDEVEYGPYFKLPNLLVKRLCLYREVPLKDFNRLVWYLHVPLDSYTILAVKNCVESFPDFGTIGRVPRTASMSFVTSEKMYDSFQLGIREIAHEAGVPPIALDCLAWDAGHNEAANIFQIDLANPAFKTMASYADRIGSLLNSTMAKPCPELTASLDDFLGAVYALVYAKISDFQDRPNLPIEVSVVAIRAEQVGKGVIRKDGKWMAGFHFNSALFRISATYHRFLKVVTGRDGNVGILRPLAEAMYRQRTGGDWQNKNVRAIHGQVTDLKHTAKGTFQHRRADAGFESAVLAVGELLNLVEVCK
jgi:hypothetical protein